MSNFLRRVAQRNPVPVSLQNLYRFGKEAKTDRTQRIRNAQFLHHELQVRIAQRVVQLENLPLGLPDTRPIQDVVRWYENYFEKVAVSPFPENEKDEEEFTEMLRFILQDNSEVIETTSLGVVEVRNRMKGFALKDQQVVDKVLNEFYLARIGLRFLIEHHITSASPLPGFAGIIQSDCKPADHVRSAAQDACSLCEYHLGYSPEVLIRQVNRESPDDEVSFTYVPGHLQYMLTEILKNACRATAEHYGDSHDSLPPIRATIVSGKNDVTIRITDQGGGIKREQLPLVWSYLHSTAPDASLGVNKAALAGYGVGLPLSRLYARYFGGDLDVKSLEGFGTDAYIHLSRLGHNCEELPDVVKKSPAESDSTVPRGNSAVFFFGNRSSWKENVEVGTSKSFHSTDDA